jgi:uncharacterized protein (DUF2345 family)
MWVHTGQAIAVLGGNADEGGVGLQIIAANNAVDIQAQSDRLKVRARDEVKVLSPKRPYRLRCAQARQPLDSWLSNITIEDGNITVQCREKSKVYAAKKSLNDSAKLSNPLSPLPTSIRVERFFSWHRVD